MELTRGHVVAFALFVLCWNAVFLIFAADSDPGRTVQRTYASAAGSVETVRATVVGYDLESKGRTLRTMGEDVKEVLVSFEVGGEARTVRVYAPLSHAVHEDKARLAQAEPFPHDVEYVRGQPSIARLQGGRWGPEPPMLIGWILFSYVAGIAFFVWLYRSVGSEEA